MESRRFDACLYAFDLIHACSQSCFSSDNVAFIKYKINAKHNDHELGIVRTRTYPGSRLKQTNKREMMPGNLTVGECW